jgi:hypothetical protein
METDFIRIVDLDSSERLQMSMTIKMMTSDNSACGFCSHDVPSAHGSA